jgi:hypothetical protein
MLERVNEQRAEVERYRTATSVTQKTVALLTPRWEVSQLTLNALDEVHRALKDLGLDDDADDDDTPSKFSMESK